MESYEQEALEIIEEIMDRANDEILVKLEDLFDEQKLGLSHEDEKNALMAFYHKLVADQLVNQGVKPSVIPLKFYTSGETGLPVPSVDLREVA